MASRSYACAALVLGLAVLGFSCSKNSTTQSDDTGGAPAPQFAGSMWLTWDRSARVAFIMGNLRGLWDDQEAGCGEAKLQLRSLPEVAGLTPELAEKVRFQCADKFKLPKRPFEFYEQVITDFYTRYPEDRSVEIQDVLKFLAHDLEGKLTANDIHKRVRIIR